MTEYKAQSESYDDETRKQKWNNWDREVLDIIANSTDHKLLVQAGLEIDSNGKIVGHASWFYKESHDRQEDVNEMMKRFGYDKETREKIIREINAEDDDYEGGIKPAVLKGPFAKQLSKRYNALPNVNVDNMVIPKIAHVRLYQFNNKRNCVFDISRIEFGLGRVIGLRGNVK